MSKLIGIVVAIVMAAVIVGMAFGGWNSYKKSTAYFLLLRDIGVILVSGKIWLSSHGDGQDYTHAGGIKTCDLSSIATSSLKFVNTPTASMPMTDWIGADNDITDCYFEVNNGIFGTDNVRIVVEPIDKELMAVRLLWRDNAASSGVPKVNFDNAADIKKEVETQLSRQLTNNVISD